MKTAPSNILKESEIIENHKRLVETFIKKNTSWSVSKRKKLMVIYDTHINKDNYRYYIHREIKLFIVALAHNQLKDIANYFPKGYLETSEI